MENTKINVKRGREGTFLKKHESILETKANMNQNSG